MSRLLKICFLLISVNHAEITRSQNSEDLPPLLHKAVDEVITGKYLNALLDILHFQSSNVWTADMLSKVMAYFNAQEVMFTLSSLQMSIKSYLKNLLYQPRQLLSEFQQLDQQQFRTAMKYLFNSRKDHLEMGNVILDWGKTRERIFQSPGVNRTLFLITLDKCFLALSALDCVDILSQVLRLSAVNYLQPDVIGNLPNVLLEDAFRNLSTVFKDLYDKTSANTQKALYGWMKQMLQKSYNRSEFNESTSWVSAENLWILGRYMVHLPLEDILKISLDEIRLFISYDNATKQLDTVYDITPELAQAFLERINSSGFDMRNTSTIYRLGLLVCFYDDMEQMDAAVARALLHQMIKCNHLRGFQAEVQKVLSFYNVSQMGALVTGISTQSFYSMNPKELSQIIRGTTSQYLSDLSPAQQQGILRKIAASGDFSSSVKDIQGAFFKEISLSGLWKQTEYNSSMMKEKELRRSQALYLYELLSKKNYPVDLLSTGQLVKGVTCQVIESMGTDIFLNNFKFFEMNLHLLSPYQVNCLAWKFWKVSNASIPPFLLLVLPTEYLEYVSGPLCVPFIGSLGKIEMDLFNPSLHKKNAVLQKVQECLNGSVADEYDVDLLGNLICHLPPDFLHDRMSLKAMATALHQFKLCQELSHEQKTEIKYKLLELYGSPNNWTAETTLDVGPFIALLSKAELNALAEKFPGTILQIAKTIGPISSSEDLLSTVFESVSNATADTESSLTRPDCMGTRAPSSDEIIKLAEANVFWSVQELECMDAETFDKNVELLGTVSGFNSSQLVALKEKAKQVWGSLAGWKSYHIVSLGRIALALTEHEIEELDLHSVDTISVLSQQTGWTVTQARSVLQGFLEDSGQAISTLKSFDLVGLGAILCALNSTEIMSIKTAEFSAAVARIGLLFCSTPVLRQFKVMTESVFGTTTSWNNSVLQEIGTIAGGLNEDELKAFDKNLMPYFQPTAVRRIPPEIFQALSSEQIANLGPENAAVVTRSQREHLDASQLQSLQLALDGARTSTLESPDGASTTQAGHTPAPSGAPCLSSFGIWLCSVFTLHLPF
ncbi:otoancorin isoform X3 [Falco rusticolus]|uniref:otoancorin isoform X3 n=1 Tax=Falco rusticolus TaxID=120794 RepID=UPI001886510F|nr:otoancorin isoform X3 [Falco rusticolus]